MTVADEADELRRAELKALLRMCRERKILHNPGTGSLTQKGAATLAGLSVRGYADLERGIAHPSLAMIESVADALNMSAAERSALHVLARGQDPPMPAVLPGDDWAQAGPQLRSAVARVSAPAAILDEMWNVLAHNTALAEWTGGWSDQAPADEKNIILLLFRPEWEPVLADIHELRRAAVAGLRYQYVRSTGNNRFTRLVDRLLDTGQEARDLWDRYVIGFPQRRYSFRFRHPSSGIAEASYLTGQFTPRLSMMLILVPPDLASPWSTSRPQS